MVYTRSNARIRTESAIEDIKSESESSDEDDEGIPNRLTVPPSKRSGVVTLRPQAHVRPAKRTRDEVPLSSSTSKRRRLDDQAPPSQDRGFSPTPASSLQIAPQAIDRKQPSNENSSSAAENEVSDEVISSIKSILKTRNTINQQPPREEPPSEPPSKPLVQGEWVRAADHRDSRLEDEIEVGEGSDEFAETDNSHIEGEGLVGSVQGSAIAPDDEQDAASGDLSALPDKTASLVDETRLPSARPEYPDLQQDPYEIPMSPPATMQLEKPRSASTKTCRSQRISSRNCDIGQVSSFRSPQASTSAAKDISLQIHGLHIQGDVQGRFVVDPVRITPYVEVADSEEVSEDIQTLALIKKEKWGSVKETTEGDGEEGHSDNHEQSEANDSRGREHADADAEADADDGASPFIDDRSSSIIDGMELEVESQPDIDLSVRESFSRDIELFRNRHVPYEELFEIFEGPPEDDLTTIHLHQDFLERALRLMGSKGWTGLRTNWQSRLPDMATAETTPGRSIIPLLRKLRRLYNAVPNASYLRDQNIFLAKHSDVITYYFSKIQLVVDHIRTARLEKPSRNASAINWSEEKRDEVAEEIVSLIIPTALQVLAVAWTLGDDGEGSTQFTASTAEFLMRGIGWVNRLYYPALRQLSREKEHMTTHAKKEWSAKRRKREEFGPLLEKLVDQLQHAPDMLLEKEHAERVREREREQNLRRQKRKQMQWGRDKQEREQWTREHNQRAYLSIFGKTTAPTLPSSSPSARTATTMPPPFQLVWQWSHEEKEFLFEHLRRSYPKLPDLSGYVRQELNRDLDDIKRMARDILRVMLKEACEDAGVDMSAADREIEIGDIFRSSGYSFDH
ncbi:hypothetical protein DL764_010437 [Monosporascus ibericus]|uniref:Uncharacterized protein n=1 Tax=Monosporascus ibericus TaxID=155417 RepID=A0A4Q4SRI3_9PEZI|nr:hypothetical protein DL764_010437 [Monosporascus ibericus]